jgi:predicted nucleotidyltransferase
LYHGFSTLNLFSEASLPARRHSSAFPLGSSKQELQFMDQRIPEPVRPILQDYIALVNQRLPGLIKAWFIEGSIALEGFNEHFSDIDFLVVLDRTATSAEIESLRLIHKTIEKDYPKREIMGNYLPTDAWSLFNGQRESHLRYHRDILQPQKRFDLDSVEGWILKHHGIALIGPDPQSLRFTVDWNVIIRKMRGNLNSYWAGYTRRPNRIISLYSDWGIQWTVLGVLRQFYSFREDSITTKIEAGEYALTCMPTRWHRLIQEAIDIRECKPASAYRFRIMRVIDTINFVKYVIRICNASFI